MDVPSPLMVSLPPPQWRRETRGLVKNTVAFVLITVIMYVGETGQDGGFIKDVWNAAKTASPFAAMFATLAWLDERRERREAQQQCNERTIDYVKSTNLQTTASTATAIAMGDIATGIHTLAAQVGIKIARPRKRRG